MAAVQENVARDKEQDKQWRTERDGEVGRRGGRASLLSGRRRGGLGYQEEDLAPLLSTYPPSSFPPAAAGGSGGVGGGLSGSPQTGMLRRGGTSRGGSNGNLSESWKEEKKGDELAQQP